MTTAAEPSALSQIGGFLLVAIVVIALYCLGVLLLMGLIRAAGRRRPKPPHLVAVPQESREESCSRCTYPGALLRRESRTRQLVRVCVGHANEGDHKGWWATEYPFDRDAASVVEAAQRITRGHAS